jgi:hypothetical protein
MSEPSTRGVRPSEGVAMDGASLGQANEKVILNIQQ